MTDEKKLRVILGAAYANSYDYKIVNKLYKFIAARKNHSMILHPKYVIIIKDGRFYCPKWTYGNYTIDTLWSLLVAHHGDNSNKPGYITDALGAQESMKEILRCYKCYFSWIKNPRSEM